MTRIAATVVVAGPDGAGKTTVATRLADQVLAPPLLHLHHRPGVLPRRTVHEGPVTEPHSRHPYGRWVSLFKLLYVFVDYQLGWWTKVRRQRRRGGSVLVERGWSDLAVDPRRYRLAPLRRVVNVLTRLVPRADLTVILLADPVVLASRTDELPLDELARQVEAWQQFARQRAGTLVLDADASVDALVEEVRRRLDRVATADPPGDR